MLKNKLVSGAVMFLGIALVAGGSFSFGYKQGAKNPETVIVSGLTGINGGTSGDADFGLFWRVWKLIDENYLKNSEVKNLDKVYGAVRGLVGSLQDDNSGFFNPEENKKFIEDVQGSFGGVGIELGIKKNQLVVVAPLKDTPASRAGVKAGDKIFKVNASSTEGILIEEAVRRIRGPQGTVVILTLFREGWNEPRDFKILRETITVPTLDFEMKEGGIAHVRLYSFNANSNRLFYDAIVKTKSQGGRGLLFDLRNNPGGYLEVAVQIAGWFVPKDELVVSEATRAGITEELRANGTPLLLDFPVVVLVNRGSASASEILAGALRDIRGVKIVGEQSFGKGTVQRLIDLPDNSSLKLTVAHWVLPSGKVLENGGLKPDVEVKVSDDEVLKEGEDPILQKAIEVLREEIRK